MPTTALVLRVAQDSILCDPDVRGGAPCVRGTGFPLAKVLAELSESPDLRRIARDYDLDDVSVRQAVESLALALEHCRTE